MLSAATNLLITSEAIKIVAEYVIRVMVGAGGFGLLLMLVFLLVGAIAEIGAPSTGPKRELPRLGGSA